PYLRVGMLTNLDVLNRMPRSLPCTSLKLECHAQTLLCGLKFRVQYLLFLVLM
ncbi:hypothetical protein PROFUN_16412, partial [Planoprotostelium fungivorum]